MRDERCITRHCYHRVSVKHSAGNERGLETNKAHDRDNADCFIAPDDKPFCTTERRYVTSYTFAKRRSMRNVERRGGKRCQRGRMRVCVYRVVYPVKSRAHRHRPSGGSPDPGRSPARRPTGREKHPAAWGARDMNREGNMETDISGDRERDRRDHKTCKNMSRRERVRGRDNKSARREARSPRPNQKRSRTRAAVHGARI